MKHVWLSENTQTSHKHTHTHTHTHTISLSLSMSLFVCSFVCFCLCSFLFVCVLSFCYCFLHWPSTSGRLPTEGYRRKATDGRLPTEGCRRKATDGRLPSVEMSDARIHTCREKRRGEGKKWEKGRFWKCVFMCERERGGKSEWEWEKREVSEGKIERSLITLPDRSFSLC